MAVHSFFNPSSRYYYPLHWLVLILLGLAIYAQTFGYGFVFDDNYYLLNTSYIRSFDQINQIWAVLPKTRLIGIYSFALNYQINQLHPQGYHIFNFAVHLLATGLVWALATVLFKIAGSAPQELPFAIAVLFLVHPCQTQAVSYISQRFESMATVFYIGSVYSYICGRISSSKRHKIILFICSFGCAILGLLTKEVAVTIPLMILAVEFIFFNKNRLGIIVVMVGGFLFFLLFMKLVRTDLNIFFHLNPMPSESHEGDMITVKGYLLTQMRVFLTFMRLLALPIQQNLDYDYPLSRGLLHPPLTLIGMCLIGCIIFSIFKSRKRYPIIAFGLAWILITFSINLAPRANVIFEHKLYLISFGFFLMLVGTLFIIIRERVRLVGIVITLIIVLSILSFMRNQVWENDYTLWGDTARKSPYKARPYNSLGVYYGMQGNFSQSLFDLNKAIELNPNYAEAYNNRGNTYSKIGRYPQAIVDLNKAIEINPNYAQARINLGKAYYEAGLDFAKQGDFTRAMFDFNHAIEIDPDNTEAYINRGVIFTQQSNFSRAFSDYNKAIEIDPADGEAYINRGTFYAQQGRFTQAFSDYNKAITLNPDIEQVYSNRAVVYFQLKEYDKAWDDVHRAQGLGAVVNPRFINVLKQASGNFRG